VLITIAIPAFNEEELLPSTLAAVVEAGEAFTQRGWEMEVVVSAIRVGDVVTVVGSFPIVFIDHGLEAPSASIVVSVEDHGTVEFQLFLTR